MSRLCSRGPGAAHGAGSEGETLPGRGPSPPSRALGRSARPPQPRHAGPHLPSREHPRGPATGGSAPHSLAPAEESCLRCRGRRLPVRPRPNCTGAPPTGVVTTAGGGPPRQHASARGAGGEGRPGPRLRDRTASRGDVDSRRAVARALHRPAVPGEALLSPSAAAGKAALRCGRRQKRREASERAGRRPPSVRGVANPQGPRSARRPTARGPNTCAAGRARPPLPRQPLSARRPRPPKMAPRQEMAPRRRAPQAGRPPEPLGHRPPSAAPRLPEHARPGPPARRHPPA